MNKRNAQIIGFFITAAAGTLLHFTYEWSGFALVVGLFAPVNESVWEHLKLLAVPMLAFAVAEYFTYGSRLRNFWPVRLLSVLLGMGVIVALYYTWTAVAGKIGMASNIAIFLIGVWAAYAFSAKLLATRRYSSPSARCLSAVGLAILIAAFAVFSYNPPHCELFRDPRANAYGPVIEAK